MVWLTGAGVVLRLFPLTLLLRQLPPGSPEGTTAPDHRETIRRVREAVGSAARRLPWHPRCLPQALAGALMCRVRGLRVPIALGVAGRKGFAAHARLDGGSDVELTEQSPDGRTHLGRLILAF